MGIKFAVEIFVGEVVNERDHRASGVGALNIGNVITLNMNNWFFVFNNADRPELYDFRISECLII